MEENRDQGSAESGRQASPAQEPSSQPHKAQEIGKKAFEEAKAATKTAKNAFLALLADPVGGQAAAISALGPKGTLQSGIVFVASFLLASLLAAMFGANLVSRFFGGFVSGLNLRTFLSALFGAALSAAALYLSIWLAARFFGSRKLDWAEALFATGICLAPATAATLVAIVFLKVSFFGGIFGLLLFALSLLVLLLHATLTTLAGIPPRLAFVLTPSVLLLTSLLVSLGR